MEDKIKEKPKYCPYCDAELKFGYIKSGLPIFWGEDLDIMSGLRTNVIRIAGIYASVNELPTLNCTSCGIIISQYR